MFDLRFSDSGILCQPRPVEFPDTLGLSVLT